MWCRIDTSLTLMWSTAEHTRISSGRLLIPRRRRMDRWVERTTSSNAQRKSWPKTFQSSRRPMGTQNKTDREHCPLPLRNNFRKMKDKAPSTSGVTVGGASDRCPIRIRVKERIWDAIPVISDWGSAFIRSFNWQRRRNAEPATRLLCFPRKTTVEKRRLWAQ